VRGGISNEATTRTNRILHFILIVSILSLLGGSNLGLADAPVHPFSILHLAICGKGIWVPGV
jgi:hypothetical protein